MASDPTKRLRNALQLALLADNDFEALAALRAARKWLEKHGKDVHWLIGQIGSIQPRLPPPAVRTWHDAATWLQERGGYLSDKELGFVNDIALKKPTASLSYKQAAYLRGIFSRVKLVDGITPPTN